MGRGHSQVWLGPAVAPFPDHSRRDAAAKGAYQEPWATSCTIYNLPRAPRSRLGIPSVDFTVNSWPMAAGLSHGLNRRGCGYMNPGLRGRYWVQLPNSRDDISNIGNLIRIPCSIAVLRAASPVPGRNAETRDEPLSTAKCSAVLKAEATAWGSMTASGPICPPAST